MLKVIGTAILTAFVTSMFWIWFYNFVPSQPANGRVTASGDVATVDPAGGPPVDLAEGVEVGLELGDGADGDDDGGVGGNAVDGLGKAREGGEDDGEGERDGGGEACEGGVADVTGHEATFRCAKGATRSTRPGVNTATAHPHGCAPETIWEGGAGDFVGE